MVNPLDKPKFDALIAWHNEHTVMDAPTEALIIEKLQTWERDHPEEAAAFDRWMSAQDVWNNPPVAK